MSQQKGGGSVTQMGEVSPATCDIVGKGVDKNMIDHEI